MLTPIAEVRSRADRVTLSVEDVATAAAGGGGTSQGGTVTCVYVEIGEALERPNNPEALPGGYQIAESLIEDWYYIARCTRDSTGERSQRVFQYQPGQPTIAPETLARRAYGELRPAAPMPRWNPQGTQLAGIATWLWIDDHIWEPFDATASIPGLTVTASATPTHVTWDPGDGSDPITCHGPGTPYDTDIPSTHQHTDCSHIYQYYGRYQGTATITWDITWTTGAGEHNTLPALTTTTTFEIPVAERQAVGLPG